MNVRLPLLLIAPLLTATPALAQQQQDGGEPVFNLPRSTQPPADPNRQGPELDVFRGGPTTVTPPPPVVAPTITPPPPVIVTPPQAPAAQPERPAPSPRPAAPATQPQPGANVPAPASPAITPEPQPTPAQPSPQADQPASPPAETPLAEPSTPTPWRWIAAGLGALAALLAVGWLLRRRGRAAEEAFEEEPLLAEDRPEAQPPAAARPVPVPPPPPPPKRPVPPPAAAPPPPAPPSPAPQPSDRPWIDLALEVRGARLSLMGATINYVLTLHNRGQRPAEDLLIRTLIANADAGQQTTLQQFFAGSTGLPTHSVVTIAPGESQSLSGELRLLPDQIAPVQMGDRALLIPLVAFDAQYRWTGAEGEPAGTGRTGRAFIVGQEKSPPADRLAPFRLDLGPRQFRTPGSRATALELAS